MIKGICIVYCNCHNIQNIYYNLHCVNDVTCRGCVVTGSYTESTVPMEIINNGYSVFEILLTDCLVIIHNHTLPGT